MAVTESELLQLAQNAFEQVAMLYAQVITINFALAAAVYYFLNEARLPMKIFAAVIYGIGMMLYVSFIGIQAKIWDAVTKALIAMPPESRSLPSQAILAIDDDWLLALTAVFLNGGFWVLGFAVSSSCSSGRRTPTSRRLSRAQHFAFRICVQPCVKTALSHQLSVPALLHDPPFIEHHDAIGLADGR
jgi:hypothetical protein